MDDILAYSPRIDGSDKKELSDDSDFESGCLSSTDSSVDSFFSPSPHSKKAAIDKLTNWQLDDGPLTPSSKERYR